MSRRAGCGKPARPDLWGAGRLAARPTRPNVDDISFRWRRSILASLGLTLPPANLLYASGVVRRDKRLMIRSQGLARHEVIAFSPAPPPSPPASHSPKPTGSC